MRKVDPVIFDLNSDGKYASNIADGVYFDYDGDGFREKTAWADKEDGILVRDINENGFIDDGKELFGDKTVLKSGEYAKSGFEALSELDTNSDGKITNDDEAFKELKIWIDRNNDGISQSDELYTLDDKNIAEIDLNFKSSNRNDQNGNIIKNTSNYVNKDGIVGNVAEMNFTIDSMDTVYQENTEIEDELVKDIPNIKASGEMISLREAVYNNPKLGESVRKYISSTNEAERNEYLNKIIIQWTGCENIEDGSRGDNFNATKKVLEENFSEYIVYNAIEPGQFGNFYGGRNYDFVLYDGSAKKLAILVLSGHNDYGCKAVRISKEAATEEGIKCINIMSYLPSTYDYIKARIQENL